jgi:hypothetical protein
MIKITKLFTVFIICTLITSVGQAQKPKSSIWEKISPFFSPPVELQNKFGDFRSPLKFYDGRTVKTREDWEKRRKEILTRWNNLMGKWPALIKDQKIEIIESTHKEGYTKNRVRFYWNPKEKTDGYLLVPDGGGKKPAVITVYYEPETAIGEGAANHDFALQLTKRGFVTLSIGTSRTTKSRTYAMYYPDIDHSQVQPLSMLACASANAWYALSKVPDVDSTRIGIMGHSYGGKWAMFSSCLFDKFACSVWCDPGIVFDESRVAVNYWEPWYLGYYPPPWNNTWRKTGMVPEAKGLYPKLINEGYDLTELHALMAPRPFLVSGGSEDTPKRWLALNHTIEINHLLGFENRVAMTNRTDHSPNQESNEQICMFFEYFLKYNKVSTKPPVNGN